MDISYSIIIFFIGVILLITNDDGHCCSEVFEGIIAVMFLLSIFLLIINFLQ
jgi:hypothetical protein